MRRILIAIGGLLAAAAPAWAQAPGLDSADLVRCTALYQRAPQLMDKSLVMMRALAQQMGGAGKVAELEREAPKVRAEAAVDTAALRAAALKSVGGNEAVLTRELAKADVEFAEIDRADPSQPMAMLGLLQKYQAQGDRCEAAAKSLQASKAP